MGGRGEATAGASTSEPVSEVSVVRRVWIVTERYRRKPALRAILHGEVGRKAPREWHDRLAVGLEAVGLEAVGLDSASVAAFDPGAAGAQLTTGNQQLCFPQQLFSAAANQKCEQSRIP